MCTRPEIEMLLILKMDDYDDFCKVKSSEKPSSFCKRKYGYSKNKGKFGNEFLSCKELIEAIKKYDSIKSSEEYTLWDLIKSREERETT